MGWIKLTHESLWRPEVTVIAKRLGVPRIQSYGLVCAWFLFVDQHACEGVIEQTPHEAIDAYTAPGMSEALEAAGWIVRDGDTVTVVHHDRHMSESAKDRALKALRAGKSRAKSSGAPRALQGGALGALQGGALSAHQNREEKRRKDKTAAAETRGREATPTGRPTAAAAAAADDFYSWLLGIGFTPEQAAETSEHEHATPERVAWVRSEASARENPGGFVRAAIRDAYAVPPSKRELRERKQAEKLAKLTGGDP